MNLEAFLSLVFFLEDFQKDHYAVFNCCFLVCTQNWLLLKSGTCVTQMSKHHKLMSIKTDNSEKLFQDVPYGIHKLHSSDQNFYKTSRCLEY